MAVTAAAATVVAAGAASAETFAATKRSAGGNSSSGEGTSSSWLSRSCLTGKEYGSSGVAGAGRKNNTFHSLGSVRLMRCQAVLVRLCVPAELYSGMQLQLR